MKIDIKMPGEFGLKKDSTKEMLSHRILEDGRHYFKINSSSLDIMQTCLRKVDYCLNQKLVSPHESPATRYGTAIHAALEVYYSGRMEERKFTKACSKNMALLAHNETEEHMDCLICNSVRAFVRSAEPLAFLDMHDRRSIPTGIYTLEHYFTKYVSDPYVVYERDGEPFVEKKFCVNIVDNAELVIDLFGTIDVILMNPATKQVLVTDHKTTSVLGNQFFNRLKPNHQYSCYLYGAQQALGIETDMFMVNGIEVKNMPKTARGAPHKFVRQITKRDDHDFEELKKVLIYYCGQYVSALGSNTWPLGPVNACSSYNGCQYLEICSAHPSIKKNIINAKYRGQ